MKPYKIAISFLIMPLLLSFGWAQDLVREDFLNYIKTELPKVVELEKKAIEQYNSATGDNFKDNQTLYTVLNEQVIPTYLEFMTQLANIKPKTEEVTELHQVYIEVANLHYEAFMEILLAIKVLIPPNEKLNKAKQMAEEWQASFQKLCQEHGLEIKKEEAKEKEEKEAETEEEQSSPPKR